MLTTSIGADWESENSDSYPTPGSITMAKPLEAMRLRFEKLQEDKKDVLRSLVLLLLAGIPSLTHRRVQAVIEEVFQRNVLLGDCLQALADSAFLRRPALQDPILPEPAYLLGIRSYSEGKNPRDDFPKLIDVLASLEDLDGILYLSVSFGSHLGDYANALVVQHH